MFVNEPLWSDTTFYSLYFYESTYKLHLIFIDDATKQIVVEKATILC